MANDIKIPMIFGWAYAYVPYVHSYIVHMNDIFKSAENWLCEYWCVADVRAGCALQMTFETPVLY